MTPQNEASDTDEMRDPLFSITCEPSSFHHMHLVQQPHLPQTGAPPRQVMNPEPLNLELARQMLQQSFAFGFGQSVFAHQGNY
jgi:hypothetical protein